MSKHAGPLGELEAAVLEVLWRSHQPLSVRDVLGSVRRKPALAYTTVLTVLDRMHDKGLVVRDKEGRAFLYSAAMSREAWFGERAARALADANPGDGDAVLMAFLDSTERVDPALLDDLSRLIAERKRSRRK
ncbi:MAG: BlaI/MecI/CopY family transcriptional regulator [Polyangiaceae bacterium]